MYKFKDVKNKLCEFLNRRFILLLFDNKFVQNGKKFYHHNDPFLPVLYRKKTVYLYTDKNVNYLEKLL